MTSLVPTVSVIVPTHNRVRLLPLTLHSVLQQQDVEIEVIVVDDGSTDDPRGTVHELEDPRVRVLRQEVAMGVSLARNRGVVEAGGRWVAFVDDDDLWAPNKLVTQVRAAEKEGRGWAYAGSVNVSRDLRLLGGAPPAAPDEVVKALPHTNLIPGGCSGVVVLRDLLPSNPFDPAYRHLEDWDLWIRLSRLDRPVGVAAPLVGYRIHDSNKSLDTTGLIAELDMIEGRYGGPIDRARFYRHLARVALRASRHRDGLRYYYQAAAMDRQYLRGDFVSDLMETAQGMSRRVRDRLMRAITGRTPPVRAMRTSRRYAANQPWLEQARPWLNDLATHLATNGSMK